jgi:RNA recognition motif-containing protein
MIRNLAFDLKPQHLKKEFAKFGEIEEVQIPLKNETNMNRGFGFIQFKTKEMA